MKKALKIISVVLFSLLVFIFTILGIVAISMKDYKLDKNKLIDTSRTITFYDTNGELILEESAGKSLTKSDDIPEHVKNAFISIEDKRFYSHHGVDYRGLMRATVNNLKSRSFKEGGSTITQQLIKNTHLSGEKTLKRKLIEIKLSRQLEKKFNKDEILEMYLNTIYFGDNCYGITSASKHYFDKKPEELTINEGATLAGIIKAPSNYSPFANLEKCNERKNLVVNQMYSQGYVTKEEHAQAIKSKVTPTKNCEDNTSDFLNYAKKELYNYLEQSPYLEKNYKVETTIDLKLQENVNKIISEYNDLNVDKSIIVLNKNAEILAYYTTCGQANRQLGSVLKPILVYAPAIETESVSSYTKILDEKTDFNGYSPSNYKEKYYGNISVKESLAKSMNVSAVKILNYTGVDTALSFANKTNIPFTTEDNSLCLALGATKNGATLEQITSAYSVFLNKGYYLSSKSIKNVNGVKSILSSNEIKRKVYSEDTVDIMNDMLLYTTTDGTAKKLTQLNFPVYSKTGTVGNESGNTDAYNISYTKDYIVGVWCGNKEQLMQNNISGGTIPTQIATQIWQVVYQNNYPGKIENSNKTEQIKIDKLSYENENKIVLADINAPERYNLSVLEKKSKIIKDKSTRFSSPKIDKPILLVNKKGISIELCLTEYYDAQIFRIKNDENKELIYDTSNGNKNSFLDYNVLPSASYSYFAVPYFKNLDKTYFGEEIFIGKIKYNKNNYLDDWWIDEFN